MREHANAILALIALAIILSAALCLALNGMKDSSLLVVLCTGAVGIGQAIAGIKPSSPPPPQPPTITASATVETPK